MIDLSGDIWDRWAARREELQKQNRWQLAGLFRGHEGPNFRTAAKKVLYTGKATGGEYRPGPEDDDYFGNNNAPFWSFARRFNLLTGSNAEDLENLAWSNLCKIGTCSGNPDDALAAAQSDLAVETLRKEWLELEPTLVVCVAEGYQEPFIYKALEDKQNVDDGFSCVPVNGFQFWIRPRIGSFPPILWMRHPQFRTRKYLAAAEALAGEVLNAIHPHPVPTP